MKLEDLLMDRTTQQKKKKHTTTRVDLLQMEVVKLQEELQGEQTLNSALQCAAFHASISPHPSSFSLLPPKVEKLISELAMVEEEIVWLERKVEEMNVRLHHERKQNQHWQMMMLHSKIRRRRDNHPNHVLCAGDDLLKQHPSSKPNYSSEQVIFRKHRQTRKAANCIVDSTKSSEELAEEPRWHVARSNSYCDSTDYKDSTTEKPNELSEELIKCLIGVFLQLNQQASGQHHRSTSMPKLALACVNSIGKTTSLSLSCRIPPPSSINHNTSSTSSSNLDPYAIFPDSDSTTCFRDIGPYKNCIHITRNSLDITRFPDLLQAIGKLRDLMRKLCNVDLTFLTYKQKLAFWINIYNACIMHVL